MRAVTRKEKIWKAMMNDDPSAMANPVTREEKKLAKLAKVACEKDLFCEGAVDSNALIEGNFETISSAVTNIRAYALHSCTGLTYADFPNATNIGKYAFYGCTALKEANFPNATSAGGNVFDGCTKLEIVRMPKLTKLPSGMLGNCNALNEVSFPAVTAIDPTVFGGCISLQKACFDSVMNPIYNNTFDGCIALKALVLRGNALSVFVNSSLGALYGTPIQSGEGYIYVPATLVDSYKAAPVWSTYAAQFRALEDYTVDGTITGALDESKI